MALEAEGSNPSTHLTGSAEQIDTSQTFFTILGRRQAVRHRVLIPAFAGSNPVGPAWDLLPDNSYYGPLAQSVEHLTFNQVVAGSIPTWLTFLKVIMYMMTFCYFTGYFGSHKVTSPQGCALVRKEGVADGNCARCESFARNIVIT